jgi:glucose-1-phosphate thymidylyltransferase
MKVLILAGGFAKRLYPLTSDKAKPLLPIAGRPVVSHIVDSIPRELPIIVSTNATFAPDFEAWKATHPDRDITVFVEPAVSEDTKKGALGAVGLAIKEFGINEDLLMIGGDNFFTFSIADFIAAAEGQPMLAVYDIEDREGAKKYGVVIAEGNVVKSFQEKPDEPLSTLVGTCCYYFPAHALPTVTDMAEQMPDRLGGVFEEFLKRGIESHIYTFKGYWNDIGSFRAYVEAHVHAGAGTIAVPQKFLDPSLGNTFEGVNHIDPSCDIRHSFIKDSIVLADAHIHNSRVDLCVVDKRTKLDGVDMHEQIV